MGGFRLRKSVRIAPGVRLSVTKTGLGLSAGVRGARYSVHTSGRRTTTVGIPGTGVSYIAASGGGSRRGGTARQSTTARSASPAPTYASGAQAAALLPGAGFFASAATKRYRDGLVAYLSADRAKAAAAFEACIDADATLISAHLLAALSLDASVHLDRVTKHLEAFVTSPATFPDSALVKFLPAQTSQMGLDIRITDLISARVPLDRGGATMLLAEAYQEAGRLQEAIGLIQQLHAADPVDPAVRLSLADLLFADEDYDGVVEVATGTRNEDDVTAALLHLRAAALIELGHNTAAFDAFRDALAKTAKRDPGLLATVRYDRALAFERTGQKGRARADFERLYAADPTYRDVRERLDTLA
jgi:tetratricopeptide (TPR) repeat protein